MCNGRVQHFMRARFWRRHKIRYYVTKAYQRGNEQNHRPTTTYVVHLRLHPLQVNASQFKSTTETRDSQRMPIHNPEACGMETILNHIVLPERLPSGQEKHVTGLETDLADSVLHAIQSLIETAPAAQFSVWDGVRSVISATMVLNNTSGGLERLALLQHFRMIQPGGFLILHVREQNAGLIIRRPLTSV